MKQNILTESEFSYVDAKLDRDYELMKSLELLDVSLIQPTSMKKLMMLGLFSPLWKKDNE